MINVSIHHPIAGKRRVHQNTFGVTGVLDVCVLGQRDLDAMNIYLTREEALAMAAAFTELAKDIEGAEGIARLGNMGEVA